MLGDNLRGFLGFLLIAMATIASCAKSEAGSDSPLADYLGLPATLSEADAQLRERLVQRDEIVADCMRSQGFSGFPFTSGSSEGLIADFGELELDDAEYAAHYGFGITTTISFEQDEVDAESAIDPYSEFFDGLSTSDADAALRALEGTDVEPGCREVAVMEAFEQEERISALQPELELLEQRIAADPTMVELTEKVRSCISERGVEFNENSTIATFQEAAAEIMQAADLEFDAWRTDPDGPSEFSVSTSLRERLAQHQEEERSVAVAVHDCQSIVEKDVLSVRRGYEEDFLSEISK